MDYGEIGMYSTQLVNFLMIIECGSINKAAQRLFMSQPTLSQQVKQLEEELGTSLFERNGKSLCLTPEGELLAEFAEKEVNALHNLQNRINAMKYGLKTVLALGIAQTSLIPNVGKWLGNMNIRHPEICYRIVNNNFTTVLEMMDKGELDICLTRQIVTNADFLSKYDYRFIMQHRVVAVVPPSMDFGDVESISLKDLDGKNVILRNKHDKRFLEKCAEFGSVPIVKAQCRNNLIKLTLVKNNVGVGFFLDSILDTIAEQGMNLKYYRVDEIAMTNKTYVVFPKEKKDSVAVRCFLESIFGEGWEKQKCDCGFDCYDYYENEH